MGSQARFIVLLAGSSGAFAGFAELGPRHGFGAVALLFGDIYAEILSRPTRLSIVSWVSTQLLQSLKLSTVSAGNTLARMP